VVPFLTIESTEGRKAEVKMTGVKGLLEEQDGGSLPAVTRLRLQSTVAGKMSNERSRRGVSRELPPGGGKQVGGVVFCKAE